MFASRLFKISRARLLTLLHEQGCEVEFEDHRLVVIRAPGWDAGLPQFSKFLWDRYEITAAGDGERYHWRLRLSYFTVGNLIFHCAVAGIFLVAADRVILLPLLVFSSLLLPAAVFLQADGFLRALEYRLHS